MHIELKKSIYIIAIALLLFLLLAVGENTNTYFYRLELLLEANETIYSIVDLAGVFICISIFLQGMFYYQNSTLARIIVFSSAFLSVAVFGAFQMLVPFGLIEMPLTNIASLTSWFGIVEGYTATITITGCIFLIKKQASAAEFKPIILAAAFLYTVLVSTIIFSYSHALPDLGEFSGGTSTFAYLSYLLGAFYLCVFIRAAAIVNKQLTAEWIFVMLSAFFLGLSFLLATFADSFLDRHQFISHLFKSIGYLYLLRSLLTVIGKRPYEQLQNMSNQYSLLLHNVVEGIYGVDLDGKVTFINESAAKMIGYREDELTGRVIHTLIHHTKNDGTIYPQDECPINISTVDGETRTVSDELFWRKDGTSFPVEYFTRPLFEDGVITGTVVTFMDISEKKNLEKLQEEQRNFEYELELAVSVQRDLLAASSALPDFVSVGVYSSPYKKLNGDFYAFSPFAEKLSLAIADVCGKGIPAAIQMTMMKFAMEMNRPPDEIMGEINQFFTKHLNDSSFITMFIGNYCVEDATFTYTSAGHEPALLYKPAAKEFYELSTNDPLLGILPDISYKSGTVTLEKGDMLLLYTDGIIERRGNKEDSNRILKESLKEINSELSPQEIVNELYEKVANYHKHNIEDDQTLILVKIEKA